MSYIGNTNTTQAFTPAVDFFNGNGSTTAFTLSRPVASVAQVQAVISNVPQNPGSAYTVSGNTITFTSAPPSGTANIYVYYTSPITQVIAPGQGTVTSDSFGVITNFTTTGNTVLGDATTDTLNVGNGSLVKDASGNLGLGVTPSAWSGSFNKVFQMPYGVIYGYSNNEFAMAQNMAAGNYVASAVATLYQQITGKHVWSLAASGTAGNAISWTQAMTLDASGNLGVGTTSMSPAGSRKGFVLRGNANGTELIVQSTSATDGTSEGMALVAAGTDCSIINRLNGFMTFNTNNTERARIDSSGNLLVGTTSTVSSSKAVVDYQGGGRGLAIVAASNASGSQSINFWAGGTQVGSVSVSTTATSYNTSSDYRLKNTIAPMTGALAKVAALKPVTYKWNVDGSDGEGFIAHELAEVCPDAVHGEKDAVDAEGNPVYQGIDTSFLVATLTAAIQEQQALIASQSELIETLTQRITALESK